MKKILIGLGILAAIAIIVIGAVRRRKAVGEDVYASEVARGDVVTVVTGTGVVQPRTKVNISSEIYGQIVAIPVKEGQVVRKGDLLVRIDAEKYRSENDRLAANARVNRIAIESEDVGLRNLEREQQRARELFAQGILSRSELEKADLAVESSHIQLKSLQESVAQAEAALSRARGDLSKTTIYAPMAGKITQVNTEVGEQVIVGTTNIPGSVLMVISDMSEVLAEVSVDETEVVHLRPGQKARVTADAVEKTVYEGSVTEIRNTAKREGDVNVFGVKVLLANPDERLRPGMTAKAKIEVDKRAGVLRVPIQAVTTRERKKLDEQRKMWDEEGKKAGGERKKLDEAGKQPGAERKASAVAAAGGTDTSRPGDALAGGSKGSGTAQAAEAQSGGSGDRTGASSRDAGAPGTAAPGGGETDAGRLGTPDAANGAQRTGVDSRKASPGADLDSQGASSRREAPSAPRSPAPKAGATMIPAGVNSSGSKSGAGADAQQGDRDEIEVVYVIEKDAVRAVPVTTGATDEAYVEIKSGLAEGTTVVTGPYRVLKKLKDADRVVKKSEEEAREAAGSTEESGSDRRRSD